MALAWPCAAHAQPPPSDLPGIPVMPILGILSCLALMIALPLDTWLRLLVWTIIGVAIYFGYGVKHAHR